MNRQPLLNLLAEYQSHSEYEQQCVAEIQQFVDTYPNCFQRECRIGHITASAWIEHPDEPKALLTLHRKLGKWLQLGGHADGETDVLSVALREAQEESGITNFIPIFNSLFDVDIHTIPAFKNEPEHLHFDVRFLLKAESADIIINDTESVDLRWFTAAELDTVAIDESLARMKRKWFTLKSL